MTEWQPIETLPDGPEWRLIWRDGDSPIVVRQPRACAPGIWHLRNRNWVGLAVDMDNATHWMPIPDPPAPEKD